MLILTLIYTRFKEYFTFLGILTKKFSVLHKVFLPFIPHFSPLFRLFSQQLRGSLERSGIAL